MSPETIYRAAHVVPVSAPPIREGYVAVRDGVITGVGPTADRPRTRMGGGAGGEIDLGRAVLMPAFTNAHTHLELSDLAGAVPGDRGFVAWIEDQLRVRAERTPSETEEGIVEAIAFLEHSGTAAVADVSNSLASVPALRESNLHALVLHEVLGFDPSKAEASALQTREAREGARTSLAGGKDPGSDRSVGRIRIEVAAHAPHSVSRELFARLQADGPIRSIHVAESRSEDVFLRGGSGDWREFLDRRVGPIPFDPPGLSPVRYLDSLGVLTPDLLAVHCVRVSEDDAKLLAQRGAVAVLCPRSNEYLGNGVPPLALLLGQGVRLALGTDSLASCPSLDVLEDARFLARRFPRVPAEAILSALTRGGAQALGFPGLGEIRPGALARFAVLPFEGAPAADPIRFLLHESVPARGLA